MKHNKNTAPSIRNRTKAVAASAMLALALTGSNVTPRPLKNNAPEAPAPNPEEARSTLNRTAYKTAQSFAAKILNRYASGGENTARQLAEVPEEPGVFSVSLDVGNSQLGRQYNTYVRVRRNEFGQLDPATVSQVYLGVDGRTSVGRRDNNYYSLGMYKIKNGDEKGWRIVHHEPNNEQAVFHSTLAADVTGSSRVHPLTGANIMTLANQSEIVLDGLSNNLPASFPPAAFLDKFPQSPVMGEPSTTIPSSKPRYSVPTTINLN